MIHSSVAEVASFVPQMCWSVLFASPQLLSSPSADIISLLLARLIIAISGFPILERRKKKNKGLQSEARQGQGPV